MTIMNYRKAVSEAIRRAMIADERVVFLGEDVGSAGGAFKTTVGLKDEFGPSRVWDTPISEQAIIGAAVGASMRGLRPIAEIMFADFLGTCWDGIVNHTSKLRYMSGGQIRTPLVVRVHGGAGLGFGAQHSQLFDGMAMAVTGLRIVMPSTPRDVVGMIASAVRSDDPVLVIEHKGLFDIKGEVPDEPFEESIDRASVVRAGSAATLVTIGAMVHVAMAAAERLASRSIEVEVIDLRSLSPIDLATVAESVSRTSSLVLVEEGPGTGGWSAEVAARAVSEMFWSLERPVLRISSPAVPVPYATNLEAAWVPSVDRVEQEIERHIST